MQLKNLHLPSPTHFAFCLLLILPFLHVPLITLLLWSLLAPSSSPSTVLPCSSFYGSVPASSCCSCSGLMSPRLAADQLCNKILGDDVSLKLQTGLWHIVLAHSHSNPWSATSKQISKERSYHLSCLFDVLYDGLCTKRIFHINKQCWNRGFKITCSLFKRKFDLVQ